VARFSEQIALSSIRAAHMLAQESRVPRDGTRHAVVKRPSPTNIKAQRVARPTLLNRNEKSHDEQTGTMKNNRAAALRNRNFIRPSARTTGVAIRIC
jgi:hypothetical protein